jgi:hypothetical protein
VFFDFCWHTWAQLCQSAKNFIRQTQQYWWIYFINQLLQCQLWTNKHPAAGCLLAGYHLYKYQILTLWGVAAHINKPMALANSEVDIPTVTFPGGETPAF